MSYKACLQYLVWVSGLSASLITPVVLCLYVAYWLQKRFMLGNWVILLSLVLGICAAIVNIRKFFKFVREQAEKRNKED